MADFAVRFRTRYAWRGGRQHLAELALAMQADAKGRQVQVNRRWAAERLAAIGGDANATDRAETFLAEEEVDSGIVVRRGHQLKFWHLTFQEYLAAQALAGKQDDERARLLLAAERYQLRRFTGRNGGRRSCSSPACCACRVKTR